MSALSDEIVAEAWIGDAVLALYIRLLILEQSGRVDGERSGRMTSNQFLAALSEPTRVEAEIGRVYRNGGIHAAFSWIEANLLSLLLKQEDNFRKRIR